MYLSIKSRFFLGLAMVFVALAAGEIFFFLQYMEDSALRNLSHGDGVVYPFPQVSPFGGGPALYVLEGILPGAIALLLVTWFFIRRVVDPLQAMTHHVKILPQLPPNMRFLNVRRKDEIGILAEAFDQMVSSLEARQEELAKRERHLAEAQKVARVGSWEYDPATGKIVWSSVLFDLMGRSPDLSEPTYEELVNIIHPEDRGKLDERVFAALTEGKPYRFDYRVVAPDGALRHLAATGEPVFDDYGRVVGLFGTVMDITERKRAEEELRNSEARFRTIFEAARDAVVLADVETGIVVDANPQAEKLLGRPKQEIIGMHQSQLHPQEDESYSREAFAQHIVTDGVVPVVHQIVTSDGTHVPVEIKSSTIELAPGKRCLMGIFRDITERKRSEEEILTLNRNLREWGNELASVNRELEAFSYSLSHDLKGHLTSISVAAEALQALSGELGEDAGFCLSTILSQVERMEELFEAMLLLSRVTRAEMWDEEVDLSKLVSDMAARLKHENPERRIEWDITPGITVWGDARLLMAALENLVGNAWKYTGKTEVAQIAFGVLGRGEEVFFIRDNGDGFDMAKAERLFHPFHRLHDKGEFKGSGIGLATVQRIVQRHGGRIWAEAQKGKGATFFFTLSSRSP